MDTGDIKKQIRISVILVSIVSIVLVLVGGVSYFSIKDTQEKEAQKYMKEIVSQYKNIITAQIDGDIQTLSALSNFIGGEETVDLEFALAHLEEESSHNDFMRMGLVSPDGTGYFIDTDGTKHYDIDVSDEAFIKKTLSSEQTVSESMKDKLSEDSIICYGVPVYAGEHVIGALTATRLESKFSDVINQQIFDGAAYAHIVDQEGNFIIRSKHAAIQKQMDNVFDDGETMEDVKKSVLADLKKGGDVFATFHHEGNAYWATFIPIGINDWQIFCVVPQTFLNHNLNSLFTVFAWVMGCLFVLFGVLFFYIYSLLKKEDKTLQTFAYKDILTGADNRNRFVADLAVLLKERTDYAVVLMNVSGFKFVNEFFGFERGNLLLKHVSSVLRLNMEEGERYYRDNADHFGMLLFYHSKEELTGRIKKIYEAINQYTVSPNQEYRINCTFGIHVLQEVKINKGNNFSPDTAINGALLALNSVNGSTANPIAFYDQSLHDKARKKVEIESQMQAALANKEFQMYLQPKYYLEDECIHSAEALVRWCSEDGTIHYPDEFIPIFEENGFITELDMYMLEEACRKVSGWIRQGYEAIPISVNQSRIFFYDDDYLDKFYGIVNQYHIDPSLIILEVTESVAMSNLSHVKGVVRKLHNMGFTISMDDFGSGYSSLNTLKELDIAELKLDKEFLSEQSTSPRGKMVIESIIHLAKALSITTVAEGIENEVQLEFLKSISCDIGQGFYFAKPMPVDEFEQIAYSPVAE